MPNSDLQPSRRGCEMPIGCRSAPSSLRGRGLEGWGLEGVGPGSNLAAGPTPPPRDPFLLGGLLFGSLSPTAPL